jgi:hypothetical protein
VRLLLPARGQVLAHVFPVVQFFKACIGVHPYNDTGLRTGSQALS